MFLAYPWSCGFWSKPFFIRGPHLMQCFSMFRQTKQSSRKRRNEDQWNIGHAEVVEVTKNFRVLNIRASLTANCPHSTRLRNCVALVVAWSPLPIQICFSSWLCDVLDLRELHFGGLHRRPVYECSMVSRWGSASLLPTGGGPVADPGGPWRPGPPCPQDFFKIMQFSSNFKGKTLLWAHFGLRAPHWGQNSNGPPDQNLGSAPGGVIISILSWVVFSMLCTLIEGGGTSHPQCLYTASCSLEWCSFWIVQTLCFVETTFCLFSWAQFTQDAEHLATHARKLWNTLLSIGVFTLLASNIKGLQANLRANLLTRPVWTSLWNCLAFQYTHTTRGWLWSFVALLQILFKHYDITTVIFIGFKGTKP